MTRPLRMVALVDRRFPTDHSFLEGVLARRLPARGVRLLWVMQSAEPHRGVAVRRWRGQPVIVLPRRAGRGFVHLVIDRIALLWRVAALRGRIRAWRPDVAFVRNEPVYLLATLGLQFVPGRVLFQLSHFKEEEVLQRAAALGGPGAWGARVQGSVARFLRRTLTRRVQRVLPISDAMGELLCAEGIPPRRLATFPLGIDPADVDLTAPLPDPLPGRSYLIQVGTLAAVRRPEVIVQAFAKIADDQPTLALLFLGGGHTAGDQERLAREVARLGLVDRVVFHPPVPRRAVTGFVRKARFALSLVAPEGILRTISPTKLMEALAAGMPVLGSRGIPEQESILEASGGGMLVAFDVEAIADGMRRMLAANDLAEWGARGRAYILAHRGYDAAADRLAAIVREVAA